MGARHLSMKKLTDPGCCPVFPPLGRGMAGVRGRGGVIKPENIFHTLFCWGLMPWVQKWGIHLSLS